MPNLTWQTVDKTFDDADNGRRLIVNVTHGGMECRSDKEKVRYSPTTWGSIAILPKADEDVEVFAEKLDMKNAYASFARRLGKEEAERKTRKNGIEIVGINTQLGVGEIWDAEGAMNKVSETLSKGGLTPLSAQTAEEMGTFLAANISKEARSKAQAAFHRTGGKAAGPQGAGF
jgi:hypothetical protein